MFEFRERLGNRCFKGIIDRITEDLWSRDLWVYFEIVLKTIRKHSSIKLSMVNPGYEISILVDFYSISRIR